MKLLIEIPEKMYHKINAGFYDYGDMNLIIQNGIPLDKIRSNTMQALTNWNTFLKLWAYFTAFDITIFMMISNIYINVYLKYKNKKKKEKR